MSTPSLDPVHCLFADDLRRIRASRGFTVDDVYRGTKSPVEIVRLFEQTALIDHARFNDIYLRSFVKSYARIIGLPEAEVLAGLEAAREGRYRGELGRRHLDAGTRQYYRELAPAPPSAPPQAPVSPPPVSRRPIPPSASKPSDPRAQPPPELTPPLLIGVGIVGVLILALLLWGLVRLFSSGTPDVPAPEPVVEATRPTTETPGFTPVQPPLMLPDTVELYMIASGGMLEGIRVSVDGGPARRRWVETGDSLRLNVTDRLEIDAGPYLGRMTLRMRGHVLPLPASGRTASLTREDLRRALETSR